MSKRTTTVTDGAYPADRMRELGRRGAAAVDRGAGGRFVKRAPADAGEPSTIKLARQPAARRRTTPPAPPPAPADEPTPRIERAPSLLRRFLGRDR